MDFAFTEDQQNIRDAVLKHCAQFSDDYWLERDREGAYPADFHRSMADAGWLGVAMPEAYGGAGLGITEAAIMMQPSPAATTRRPQHIAPANGSDAWFGLGSKPGYGRDSS